MTSKSQLKRRAIQCGFDFSLLNGGSVWLLTPVTEAAQAWTAEHLPEDGPMLGTAHAIESRFVADIFNGITNDGLTVDRS